MFNCAGAEVMTESSIGAKSEDGANGGRMDILIESEDHRQAIIIENKIYAGDQDKQLLRYNNYAKDESFESFKLLYLTLDGHKASDESTGGEIFNYKKISYGNEILRWLSACQQVTFDKPLVRETISQYITLIKQLTNQNMDNEKEAIVTAATKDKDTLRSALKIADSKSEIQNMAIKNLLIPKLQNVAELLQDDNTAINFKYNDADWCFIEIRHNETEIEVSFKFADSNFKSLWWGITKPKIKDFWFKCFECDKDPECPMGCTYYHGDFSHWDTPETFSYAIEHFHEQVKGDLHKVVEHIKKIASLLFL